MNTTAAHRLEADSSTTAWLPLNQLIVDSTIQRPLDENRAQKMADVLDLSLLGVVEVSERPNGTLHIMDGQHRVAALRLAGFHNETVECKVHHGLTKAQEAARFNGLNTFKAPRAFDRFKVRIQEGDSVALGVDRILMEHGWRLMTGHIDGGFTAVQAAERVYTGFGTANKETGPQNFANALGTVTQAWGRGPMAANGFIISGLGLFFARYGDQIDKPSLVKRLAQFAGGPDNYLGKARGIRDWRGGGLARCVAELTVEVYNKRRSSSQLEAWR